MNRPGLRLSLALLLILIFSTYTSAGTQEDMIEQYILQSGLGDMIAEIPPQMDVLATQKKLTSKNPDVETKVFQLMKESFEVKQAEKNLTGYLLQNTDRKFLGEMLQWLESPLAQKITREETAASRAENQGNMLRYLADMESNPPSEKRIALMQEVEQKTHLSELTTDIVLQILKGLMESAKLALPEDKRESIEGSYQDIEDMKATIQEGFRNQMVLTSFYTYRNISDEELGEYIKFYDSELGRKEIKITGDAIGHVFNCWFENFGEKLVTLAEEESGKRFK